MHVILGLYIIVVFLRIGLIGLVFRQFITVDIFLILASDVTAIPGGLVISSVFRHL